MDEYVSKKALLKAVEEDFNKDWGERGANSDWDYIDGASDEYDDVIDIICQMPAAEVRTTKNGRWITKAENYYNAWLASGRSWESMPYFVTGIKFACSECFTQYDVNAEGVEDWNGCPVCLARMEDEQNEND